MDRVLVQKGLGYDKLWDIPVSRGVLFVYDQSPFKRCYFQADIIFLCVSWYLGYSLSSRDLEQMMLERELQVDHTTIYRWTQRSAPELEKRCRPHLKATTDSWRVDETYVKVKGTWRYLYRAGILRATLEFLLSMTRDAEAAKRFFAKAFAASHIISPRVITVNKNASYPKALGELKAAGTIPKDCELRQSKYLNNLVEQDHLSSVWSSRGMASSRLKRLGERYEDTNP